METSWPSFIQSELALPRQVLSLGFLRQTSAELWEQDLVCPPSPTHLQMGGRHTLHSLPPNCILGTVTQIEGRGLRKPARGQF